MIEKEKRHPYGLVAFDIDGTLINKKGQVPKKTLRAIGELKDRGIHITLATGRIWASVQYLIEGLDLKDPVILHNGALIQEVTGNIIYQLSMEEILLDKVLFYLKDLPLDYLLCSIYQGKDQILYPHEPKHKWACSFLKSYKEYVQPLAYLSQDYSIIRVLVFGAKEEVLLLKNKLQEEGLKMLFFEGPSQSAYMEVFQRGCSKAMALAFLLEKLGLMAHEVMVFGDDLNDLEMIRFAGCGVAMGTSPRILKEEADYVTLSGEEGGVGEALERLLFKVKGGGPYESI